ncbi:hydroxymethylbilane synthase [Legionella oakridgensis]|uniref:Porphobilinogen deaminase n=2 Tax=Legionella oakridgensis TaxID=29423 RepID=W0BBQ9_9GAMM|nr:hydroxymethylbilane synthase [Legionella oakridgensis]AHE66067.1 porphobilinogen deaminase [Legionella oakridgensis ATCC 33761 = DSM 21215]ETO94134.1 hydroxymethylbilane synthase [Legionella oakridgensis RV-2-2007]KTD43821.1 porphobilinogen deaminase [Legionella oakridgensis]STY15987.1 porphobilinogen deaminase [Legionella longbeachae]
MSPQTLKIATRKSPLALWQANHVGELLRQYWPALRIELLPMQTSGDKFLKDKLLSVGGKGLFVKELEEALLDKRADLAVHSMKDVPASCPHGLTISAICHRHNPLDVLISEAYENLMTLPAQAIIGTSSLRRQTQLLALRPDLQIKPLRGNIQTRISKMQDGEYDAIILAAAGLERMGMQMLIKEILSDEIMLPACGQGALGIECRTEDQTVQQLLAPLNDPLSALCVNTERQVNAHLGGNCHSSLAVFCKAAPHSQLLLHAKVSSMDGRVVISNSQRGHQRDATILADNCAQSLLRDGALELLNGSSL